MARLLAVVVLPSRGDGEVKTTVLGPGSGRAKVRFVRVEAPAFQSSTLPSCMSNQAKAWTFLKFTQGPKRFSYPFVFVGG